MEVGLALEIDQSVQDRAVEIRAMDQSISDYFRDKSYGGGIEHLFICVILTMQGEDRFHPVRPFKFKRKERVRLITTDSFEELANTVSYDVKPDFEFVRSHQGRELREYLSVVVFDSTEILAAHRAKYPKFDVIAFRCDLRKVLGLH